MCQSIREQPVVDFFRDRLRRDRRNLRSPGCRDGIVWEFDDAQVCGGDRTVDAGEECQFLRCGVRVGLREFFVIGLEVDLQVAGRSLHERPGDDGAGETWRVPMKADRFIARRCRTRLYRLRIAANH